MLRFDFVGRAQQKALPVGASNVEPRKESMSSLRISGQGRGSMRKALRLQPWVAWPAMADDLTAGLDFGWGEIRGGGWPLRWGPLPKPPTQESVSRLAGRERAVPPRPPPPTWFCRLVPSGA